MKLYAAPLEGLTGYVWRRAQRQVFGHTDTYFTPFLKAQHTLSFMNKEIRDLSQGETDIVPQILTDKSELFIWAAREIQSMGYDEVNLNTGCPSGTVVPKGKGAGMLKDPAKLDRILDEIFTALPDMKISIKTRIGLNDRAEWPALLEVFSRYPITELIIHSRLRSEFYQGASDRQLFLDSLGSTGLDLVYNGDIVSADDEAFFWGSPGPNTESGSAADPVPVQKAVMVGRGLLRDPALFRQVRGGSAASAEELLEYHQLIVDGYLEYMNGENTVRHMKEQWIYLSQLFGTPDQMAKPLKQIRKTKKLGDYVQVAESIIRSH